MIVKEIIIVEGKNDTAAIKRAVKADTIETGGSAISEEIINQIKKAQKLRGVIVFTDPDFPGEKIRKIISNNVPGIKHAFIARSLSLKNKKIGVESAPPKAIIEALKNAKTEWIHEQQELISWERIINEGLVGGEKSKQKRIQLGDILGIGYANAKQLYNKLKMFQISEQEFADALKLINNRDEF